VLPIILLASLLRAVCLLLEEDLDEEGIVIDASLLVFKLLLFPSAHKANMRKSRMASLKCKKHDFECITIFKKN
jgi:hypothetical protein